MCAGVEDFQVLARRRKALGFLGCEFQATFDAKLEGG